MRIIYIVILKVINKVLFLFYRFVSLFYRSRVNVLMMHHIGEENQKYNLSVSSFHKLVDNLKSKSIINLNDLDLLKLDVIEKKWILTFDDVPESFYLNAYPILKENSIPFTIFLSTSLINTDGYLNTSQIIEMSKNPNCTIGSHGIDHVRFRNLSNKECEYQLKESKLILERIIDRKIEYFAFPYGSFFDCSFSNIKSVNKTYYKLAFSTIPISISKSKLIIRCFLPRINVTEKYINKCLS